MTNTEIEAEIAKLKKEIKEITAEIQPFKSGGRKMIT